MFMLAYSCLASIVAIGCASARETDPGQYHVWSGTASHEALAKKAKRICADYQVLGSDTNSSTNSGGTLTYDSTTYNTFRTSTTETTTVTTIMIRSP